MLLLVNVTVMLSVVEMAGAKRFINPPCFLTYPNQAEKGYITKPCRGHQINQSINTNLYQQMQESKIKKQSS